MVVIMGDVEVWLSAFMSAQHTPAIQPINAKILPARFVVAIDEKQADGDAKLQAGLWFGM